MTAREIAAEIDRLAPEALSKRLIREHSEYDNTGLLLDPEAGEISRVLVALDADREVAAEAIARGCGMILSHHPVIWRGVRALNAQDGEQRVLLDLIRAGIAVYSAHLSLDAAKGGINETLARAIGLEDPKPLVDLDGGAGLIFAGRFAGNFRELCEKICGVTGSFARAARYAEEPLFVAVCNGGGADVETMIRARQAGCNTLVSGDAKHHAFVWAKNNGFNLVDAGHFETEQFYLEDLTRTLNQRCAGVTFLRSGQTAPYDIIGGKL